MRPKVGVASEEEEEEEIYIQKVRIKHRKKVKKKGGGIGLGETFMYFLVAEYGSTMGNIFCFLLLCFFRTGCCYDGYFPSSRGSVNRGGGGRGAC
jgi:hypothetical protein